MLNFGMFRDAHTIGLNNLLNSYQKQQDPDRAEDMRRLLGAFGATPA